MKNIQAVFKAFEKLMRRRFLKKIPTTEDSMRYTFFYALATVGKYQPEEIELEKHGVRFKNKKVDLYINSTKKGRAVFEFKYHNHGPHCQVPCPQEAGSLFADFVKLHSEISKRKKAYFVYIFNETMKAYLGNTSKRKSLASLLNLPKGKVLKIEKEYFKGLPQCLSDYDDHIKKLRCRIKSVRNSDILPRSRFLRIYQIEK